MDWTMYIAIGLCVLTIGSLVMNYFNYVEIKNLQAKSWDNFNELTRQGAVLNRLEPVALLADKIDLKRRIKASKEYQADLESDLKETERELKGIA